MNKPFYKKPWFWVIIAILVLGIGGIGASQPNQSEQNDTNRSNIERSSDTEAIETSKESVGPTKNAIENECQDAKYGVNKGYDPISVGNYKFEVHDWAYTEDGTPLQLATWNGKNKASGEQVRFDCYFSGKSDDDIVIYYISAGTQPIWKSQADVDFASYNKDGTPYFPEMH